MTDLDYLVESIYEDRFAIATIGCEGGAAGLFALASGQWVFVSSTQMAFPCEKLTSYEVPKAYIDSCLQDDQVISR
jgi:hypothetical protein